MMTHLQLGSLLLLAIVIMFSISLIIIKIKLDLGSKRCEEEPMQGASITHGMVFRGGSRGVRSVEEPSYSWYQRLLK